MVKSFAIMASVVSLMSCNPTKSLKKDNISYATAKNYFVKNTVSQNGVFKITSQNLLDSIFGIGRTMSENSRPTAINFDSSIAIAILVPTSNKATKINIKQLSESQGNILLEYHIETGKEQSFSAKPFQLLILDKKYDLPLKTKED